MIAPFLHSIPLFSSLANEDIEELARVMTQMGLPGRTVLFREGDAGDRLYVVRKGEVEVIKGMGTPEEQVLRVLKSGDYFGEMSLFNPRETRSASVRTRTSVRLLELERDAFGALVERRPGILGVMARELTVRFSDSEKILIRALRKKNIQLRKQSSELRDTQDLAAMGRAASILAHDFKTPLIAIGGFTRLVQRHLEEGSADRDKLEIVLAETQRLESMVKDMLDFARPLELHRSLVEIASVLDQSLAVIYPIAEEKGIEIEKRITATLPPMNLDEARMRQALINLLVNAIQASATGQTVSLCCREGRGGICIEVEDCGCGIPAETRQKVFSPFFTTKKEGTGLGLSIVSKIVEAHQGSIEILENPGRGTIFRVEIPLPDNC